jgi:ABC-2 type transport system permease protein
MIAPVNDSARTQWQHAYGVLVGTEFRLAWRNPVGLVFGIGLPMLLLVIFGSIPSLTRPSDQFGGISFFTLYTPTLMVLVLLVLAFLSLPGQMAGYRQLGVLRRMSTTPLSAFALLGAQVAVNLVLAVISIGLLLGFGAGVFNLVLPGQSGWFVVSLVLSVAAMFGIGLCVAAFAGTPQVANAVGALLFYPLAFFSGLYVPISELHSNVIDQLSKVLPSGAAFTALHASLAGHFPGWQAIGELIAYAVVFSLIAVRWFRWDVERPPADRARIPRLLTRH